MKGKVKQALALVLVLVIAMGLAPYSSPIRANAAGEESVEETVGGEEEADSPSPVPDAYALIEINSNSDHVYQVDNTIYYNLLGESGSATAIFDIIKGDTRYNKVYRVEDDQTTEQDITTEGYIFYEETEELKLRLAYEKNGERIHSTEVFSVTLVRDETSPEVVMTTEAAESPGIIGQVIGNVIPFRFFQNKKWEVEISITDTGSGVNGEKVTYYKINTTEDIDQDNYNQYMISDNLVEPESATSEKTKIGFDPEDTEDGNWIVLVLAEDMVGNKTVYTSAGVVLDTCYQKEHPISINYKGVTPNNYIEDGQNVDYFKEDVELGVTVEGNRKGVFSGVKDISYEVSGEDPAGDRKGELFDAEQDENYRQEFTIAQLKEFFSVINTASIQAASMIDRSNEITVRVKAHDFAENEAFINKAFIIDRKSPEVHISSVFTQVGTEANGQDIEYTYTNQNVTLTTEIFERYLSYNQIIYSLGERGEVDLQTLLDSDAAALRQYGIVSVSQPVQEGEKDALCTVVTIVFGDTEGRIDQTYEISVQATDKAGNLDVDSQNGTSHVEKFVIDKVAPLADLKYYKVKSDGSKSESLSFGDMQYVNEEFCSFDIVAEITEKHFGPGTNVESKLSVEKAEESTLTPDQLEAMFSPSQDITNWTNVDSGKYQYSQNFSEEAVYKFDIQYTDLAGNEMDLATGGIILDRKRPTAKIHIENLKNNVGAKIWDNLLSAISFGLFGGSKDGKNVTVSLIDENDTLSGLKDGNDKWYYYISKDLLSESQLKALADADWTQYTGTFELDRDADVIVYARIIDKADNVFYLSSDSLVIDNVAAGLSVDILPSAPKYGSREKYVDSHTKAVTLYNKADIPRFTVNVSDIPAEDGSYAGIRKVEYTLTLDGTLAEAGVLASAKTDELTQSRYLKMSGTSTRTLQDSRRYGQQSWSDTIPFITEELNYNEIVLVIQVTDWSENTAEEKEVFAIDTIAPKVTVTYTNLATGKTFVPSQSKKNITYLNKEECGKGISVNFHIEELNFMEESYRDNLDAHWMITARDFNGNDVAVSPDSSWSSNGTNHDLTITLSEDKADANYTLSFNYTDLAGNAAVYLASTGAERASYGTDYFTLDRVDPDGGITVSGFVNGVEGNSGETSKTWWDKLIKKISFGLFGNKSLSVTMSSEDKTAGVKSVAYHVSADSLTRDELGKDSSLKWITYKKALKLSANRNVVIYQRVTDKAGNTAYYSSGSMVIDNVNPAPVITITPGKPAWDKGVYSAGDNPGFDVKVTDPTKNGAYAGLREITYRIVNGTTGKTETGTLATFSRNKHRSDWSGHIKIDPQRFYSNDVQVTVTATDWAANQVTSRPHTLKIDNKAPIVHFSFHTADAQNAKYYKNNKTLTIAVEERNFDASYTPTVTSTTGGGWSFSGWTTRGEVSTGEITFSGDGDYTVNFACYDLAGNRSNRETLGKITIDKTLPQISVSYDNNDSKNTKYYKASRTATITVNEHNFRASDVRVTVKAALDGRSVSTPAISGWSNAGDHHTATITYLGDADYTFDITCTDMAGNIANDYAQDTFTVDLTNPTVEITGVADHSANKGEVIPVVHISDINFSSSDVAVTLTGVQKGMLDVDGMVSKATTADGQIITFLNFPSGMDDIYTLTASAADQAGNRTTASITFSVNRDGSNYSFNKATQALLDKGYTNDPQDITIEEINVDSLTFVSLTYSKDGQIVELEEDKDYTVAVKGGDGKWKRYTYVIHASCFEEEGRYVITVRTIDAADNMSTNQIKSKSVEFVVDKTPPMMVISNLQDRGRYRESVHEYKLYVTDNTVLISVFLYADDNLSKEYRMIDGDMINVNDESDVLHTDNGTVTLRIGSKNVFQKVVIAAEDAAGNRAWSEEYHVLVTASRFVQFYMNRQLFFGSIAGALSVLALFIFLTGRRKPDR